jgi:hypothetical protein
MNADAVAAETRAWLERAVIGLNLCPFARAPHAKGRVRIVASDAADTQALLASLIEELERLAGSDEVDIETTLLVHPRVLLDFADYNDFLGVAEDAVAALELEGVVQVASFHPQYRFAGSQPDDIENATNRSPYPMLHLLREASVTRAVATFADTAAIFETNIATMRRLGAEGWAKLRRQCRDDAQRSAESSP